jgi:prefoldin subunit 5
MQQAQQLERLASNLHALAFDIAEPSRSIQRIERRIAEGERVADEVRAVVRGRAR